MAKKGKRLYIAHINGECMSEFHDYCIPASKATSPRAELCRFLMRCFFLLYLLTFSYSSFLRDFFPILCLLCLIPYYILDYKNSTLAVFDGKKYFLALYAFLVLGIVFSGDVWASFIKVSLHSFTSLALPFVAMESIRSTKDLRWVAYTLILTLCIQGFNGIYQYIYGHDFIHGIAIKSGRLTGSFSDYRVGNYIALSLIPALSLVWFWRPRYGAWAVPMALLCAAPVLFLMFYSYTRNAYITLFAAFFFWIVLVRAFPWKFCLTLVLGALALLPFLQSRFSLDVLRQDGRWDLWHLAVEVFQEYPLLGAGIGQYNAAFRALGLSPTKDAISISHPHNIYLQFLCENGVVGFILVMVFLLGIFYWGYKKLRFLDVHMAKTEGAVLYTHWRVTAMYWCGWGAFLASGIVGHNFFQRWWLALVMSYLGILIGALVHALRAVHTKPEILPGSIAQK